MFGGNGSRDPFNDIENFMRTIGHGSLFDIGGGRGTFLSSTSRGSWMPPMNLAETEHQFVLTVDAAGVKKDDLDVNVRDNRLCVTGKRWDQVWQDMMQQQQSGTSPTTQLHMHERGSGSFERCVSLPSRIAENTVAAELQDGVLTVNMSKEQAGTPRGSNIVIR